MKLVIVESPAKCAKIQGFLGTGWKVIASMGHIRQLKEELDAVGLERDFEPLYEWSKEKSKAIAALKAAAQGVETVYLAADDDREGEFIAYSVCLLLKLDPATCPRAVFHSITKEEVTKAIQTPRKLDMNRVNAQQARAILDMLIGFTMSPLLWKHVGGQGLSAGRCQTPALRLVVEREDEITSFQFTTAWRLGAIWTTKTGSFASDLVDDLEDEESARNFMENHVTELGGSIVAAETKPWSHAAPDPLITSTLQQQASSLLRVNPKQTMRIAQRLYEAGHITYMRTDQAILSAEAEEEAKKQVEEMYGPEYIREAPKKTAQKTKKKTKAAEGTQTQTQDAHEAIRPTHFELAALPESEDWSAQDRKLYGLIRLRALQSVMAPARGHQRTLTIHSEAGGEDFPWRASFRHTDFLGWRKAALKEDEDTEADSAEADWTFACSLQPGTALTWTAMEAKPHTTNPPQRFNEATLIRELEKRGIGRPSTFASLIGTIQEKSYVQTKSTESRTIQVKHLRIAPSQWPPQEETKEQKVGAEKDRLHPTPLGRTCLGFLLQHFDDLFLYPFTAKMEEQLDAVAKGEHAWKQVVRETWNAYKERYQTLKTAAASPEASGVVRSREFGGGLKAVMSRKGPLLLQEDPSGDKDKTVFLGWPLTSWTVETIPDDEARAFAKNQTALKAGIALGEWNGHPLVQKQGPYGFYVEWNGVRVPYAQGESRDAVIEKLEAKSAQNAETRRIGQFEIRKGPYGLYMFKHALTGPKRQFVTVPSALNLETITETELVTVFQNGLAEKARAKGYSQGQGQGGQGGSRGGSRGGRGQGGSRGSRGRGRGS